MYLVVHNKRILTDKKILLEYFKFIGKNNIGTV